MAQTTTAKPVVPGPTVAELAVDFDLTLASQNKSTATRKVYRLSVVQFAAFLEDRGMPREAANVKREHVEAFIADLLSRRSAATAKTRYGGLQVFFGWLEEEGEVSRSPMERMKPPHVPEQPVAVVDDDALRRILQACSGTDFAGRRDTAIIRVFWDSGMRRAELAGLALTDVLAVAPLGAAGTAKVALHTAPPGLVAALVSPFALLLSGRPTFFRGGTSGTR